jgi:large subunit ribosomal protein L1
MEKSKVLQAIKKAKEAKQRQFKQTFDLIVKLKDLDLKKQEHNVDFFALLHYPIGKKIKVCALVGGEMADAAKQAVDTVVIQDEFAKYGQNKKMAKKLAEDHDFFIAQANIMPAIATNFGKILGVRGKMPNPKAGCVVPPNTNLKPLYEKLQKTVRAKTRSALMIQVPIGHEDQPEEEIVDNIMTLQTQIVNHLINHDNNVSKVLLKLTMGSPVEIK